MNLPEGLINYIRRTKGEDIPRTFRDWLYEHPFWRVGRGSGDGFLFIRIYGNRFYHRRWFKMTVMPVYRVLCRVHDAQRWIGYRVRPSRKYHLVRTGLTPGYYDEDTRMLHACMAILGEFIHWHGGDEKLSAFSAELRGTPDPSGGVKVYQADKQDEAVAIWRWWKIEKPADEKRRDEMLGELFGDSELKTVPCEDNPKLRQIVFPDRSEEWEARYKEFRALEEKIDSDEQKMLHRLIDIRPGLWT